MKEGGVRGLRVKVVPPRQSVGDIVDGDAGGGERKVRRSGGAGEDSMQGVLMKKGEEILDKLERADTFGFFLEAVPTDIVTDYLDYIKEPMDLGTVRRKLRRKEYVGPAHFKADLDLIWSNCCTYNAKDTEYYQKAVKLSKLSAGLCDKLADFFRQSALEAKEQQERQKSEQKQDKRSGNVRTGVSGNTPSSVTKRSRGRPTKRSEGETPIKAETPKPSLTTTPSTEKTDTKMQQQPVIKRNRRRTSSSLLVGAHREATERTPRKDMDFENEETLQGPRGDAAGKAIVRVSRGNRTARGFSAPHWDSMSVGKRGSLPESDLDWRYHQKKRPFAKVYDEVVNATTSDAQAFLHTVMGRKNETPRGVADKLLEKTLGEDLASLMEDTELANPPTQAELDELTSTLARDGLNPSAVVSLGRLLLDRHNDKEDISSPAVAEVDLLLRENYSNILQLLRLRAESELKSGVAKSKANREERKILDKICMVTAEFTAKISPKYLVNPEDIASATQSFARSKRRR